MSFLYLPPLLTKVITADTLIFYTQAEFWGICMYNSHASVALEVSIYNGQDATGTRKLYFKVAAGGQYFYTVPNPIYCAGGLFVDVTGGTPLIFIIWRKF